MRIQLQLEDHDLRRSVDFLSIVARRYLLQDQMALARAVWEVLDFFGTYITSSYFCYMGIFKGNRRGRKFCVSLCVYLYLSVSLCPFPL